MKPIAITKYIIVGVLDVLSEPKIAVSTARTTAINKPDTAVPIVNLDTTSWER